MIQDKKTRAPRFRASLISTQAFGVTPVSPKEKVVGLNEPSASVCMHTYLELCQHCLVLLSESSPFSLGGLQALLRRLRP